MMTDDWFESVLYLLIILNLRFIRWTSESWFHRWVYCSVHIYYIYVIIDEMRFILWLVMTNSIRVHVVQSYADRRDCGRSLNPSARDVDDRTLIDVQSNTNDTQLTSFWNMKFQYIIMDTRITLWRLDAKNFHIYIFPSSSFRNSELWTTRNFDYSKSLEEKKKFKPKEHVMSKCLVALYMKYVQDTKRKKQLLQRSN